MTTEPVQTPALALGSGDPSRIVVTGKGGVGKTTLAALLARLRLVTGHLLGAFGHDVEHTVEFPVDRMEVRDAMLFEVHLDQDSVEP
jgi:MinD superfamily P-loop ATPase